MGFGLAAEFIKKVTVDPVIFYLVIASTVFCPLAKIQFIPYALAQILH